MIIETEGDEITRILYVLENPAEIILYCLSIPFLISVICIMILMCINDHYKEKL